MDKNMAVLPFLFASLLASKTCIASDEDLFDNKNDYLPYVQVGGMRFFNVTSSNWATSINLFTPVFQQPANLVFIDARFYDRTGKPFEGNIHLGYRHLIPENQQIYGIYTAFDRKRTGLGNYFNQITLGGEFWWNKVFLGCNIYQPVGNTSKLTGVTESVELKQISNDLYNIWITNNEKYEKAMGGGDFEAGYEIIKGLVGYVGGYYFKATSVENIAGPKARLTYDLFLENGKRIGGIFDKLGLEAGVQHDVPRGTVWYASANFRIGLLPNKKANSQDVSRHMVDLVRRDVDINSAESQNQKSQEPIGVAILDDDPQKIIAAIENTAGPNNIAVRSNYAGTHNLEIIITDSNNTILKTVVVGDHLNVASKTGYFHQVNIPNTKQNNNSITLLSKLQQILTQQIDDDVSISIDLDSLKSGLSMPI